MASADISMDIQRHSDTAGDQNPLIKYYRASEVMPAPVPALNTLLRKGPATCAAIQASSGILSLGIGVVFAASWDIGFNLLTLFRIPIVTGVMFVVAGILSNLLYKHPELLHTCFIANILCLCVSAIGAILLIVDLQPGGNQIQQKMEVLILCVTLMDIIIAGVLIFWFYREKRGPKK
ncbi:uncharacterized protein LOC100150242 [Danio rerio]|uniref:Si:ch211-269k10.4 n=1 Tax=Danio rerio TaxID=7955 RepID=X1WC19_DANRE|nr:uncharacterized protein LOC100150242 [Danio rerio]|eukprot:XP_001923387.1 uncharacterized protein si:ch211-269k10.4 isoform X2 [Danio rerio]